LPSWLGWLPRVNAEPSAAAVAGPVDTAIQSNSRGREAARGRIRAWVRAAVRGLLYDGAVFVWSIAAFTIVVTGVSVTSSLLVLVIAVFVWVAFVYVARWTTWVDRDRLHIDAAPVLGHLQSRGAARAHQPGALRPSIRSERPSP